MDISIWMFDEKLASEDTDTSANNGASRARVARLSDAADS